MTRIRSGRMKAGGRDILVEADITHTVMTLKQQQSDPKMYEANCIMARVQAYNDNQFITKFNKPTKSGTKVHVKNMMFGNRAAFQREILDADQAFFEQYGEHVLARTAIDALNKALELTCKATCETSRKSTRKEP